MWVGMWAWLWGWRRCQRPHAPSCATLVSTATSGPVGVPALGSHSLQ